jgi:chromosomal replication initiator protein
MINIDNYRLINYWVLPGLKGAPSKADMDRYEIVTAVLEILGVTEEVMLRRSQKRASVYSRQVVAYMLRKKTNMTLNEIGRVIGDRDHTTVIHLVNSIKGQVEVDEAVRRRIYDIEVRLENKLSV